jgi:hypothetical protein
MPTIFIRNLRSRLRSSLKEAANVIRRAEYVTVCQPQSSQTVYRLEVIVYADTDDPAHTVVKAHVARS